MFLEIELEEKGQLGNKLVCAKLFRDITDSEM